MKIWIKKYFYRVNNRLVFFCFYSSKWINNCDDFTIINDDFNSRLELPSVLILNVKQAQTEEPQQETSSLYVSGLC